MRVMNMMKDDGIPGKYISRYQAFITRITGSDNVLNDIET